MIGLSVADVVSVGGKLAFWEISEYVSEALVVIACFGEYVAEYAKWPARWTDEQRRRLGRRSLVLLIFGIAAGTVSLIQTNALSGAVIGSLGERAEEAAKKADVATTSSDAALKNAGQAATASTDAISKSDQAEGKASNALALAQGARQEADSFERDIVSAKKQAAEAESHLAEALRSAAEARAELNRLKSPRSLSHVSELVAGLAAFKDTEYTFSSVFADDESIQLLKQVDSVLQRAGWKRTKPGGGYPAINVFGKEVDFAVPAALTSGIQISVDSSESVTALQSLPLEKMPELVRAAIALNLTISSNLFPAEEHAAAKTVDVQPGASVAIRIAIGKKP